MHEHERSIIIQLTWVSLKYNLKVTGRHCSHAFFTANSGFTAALCPGPSAALPNLSVSRGESNKSVIHGVTKIAGCGIFTPTNIYDVSLMWTPQYLEFTAG